MNYGDALQEVETALKNAGINATTEQSKLHLPGALIAPGLMSFDYLDFDNYTATVTVYLLTSNKGTVHSMNDLQELLRKFRTVFNVLEADPQEFNLKNLSPDPVPGLLINLELTITKD